ncbi:hypothetical protein Tco_0167703 [Tanacetum coccineum]
MYSEEVEKESTNSGSNDDETHVTGSMKKLEEDAKAEAAKQEGETADLANKKKNAIMNDYLTSSELTKGSSHQFNIKIIQLKIEKYLHFSLCSGTKTEEGLWKELQFSLKVYKAGKRFLDVKRNKAISLGKGKVYKAGKRFLDVKRNKAISLGKGSSKVGIEV